MNAEEYYKEIFKDDYNLIKDIRNKPSYTLNSMIEFAKLYHKHKVENLGLFYVSGSLLATEVDPVEKWDNGAPMYICPNCKEAELGHGDKYCPNCGQKIEWEDD